MRVHNLLAGRSGALDWAGLPLVCAYLGITDLDGLITALEVIATHRPTREGDDDDTSTADPLNLS